MLIAALLSASMLVSLGQGMTAATGACTPDLQVVDGCIDVLNAGEHVDIGGDWSESGSGGDSTEGSTDSDSSSGSGSGESGREVAVPDAGDAVVDPCPLNRCQFTYEVVMLPDVTIADLVSFVPQRPTLTGEPVGVGIVRAPVNLIATASAHTLPGRLFDQDVTVRFTPAGFDLDHGDGTTQHTTDGGTRWETLGQAQFTPTPTSHTYTTRGTYPVTATVHYRAEVDFGTGWRPVPGTITATTTGYRIRIVEIHTALVNKTCHENPTAPSC